MKKVKLGIIGVGLAFEKLHYPALQRLSDKYEIGAICDIDQNKLELWRTQLGLVKQNAYTDYKQMMKQVDLDAFDIMVPIELNYEITHTVAEVGKPIICEKPLAPTKKQAKLAQHVPERYNISVMIGENYRYDEENNIIRDLVRTKEVGEIIYFIQNRVVDFPSDMHKEGFASTEWRQHPKYPGGVFFDTGVHDIAALRYIFGAIDNVQALGRTEEQDFAPYSVIQANMRFKNGIIGHLSFFSAGKEMQRPLVGLRIFGTKGMIYLEEASCGTVNVAYNDGGSKQIPYQPDMGFYNELLNFYKAAIGEETLSVTPEMEFGDAWTVLSILEAAEHNTSVNVDRTENYQHIH